MLFDEVLQCKQLFSKFTCVIYSWGCCFLKSILGPYFGKDDSVSGQGDLDKFERVEGEEGKTGSKTNESILPSNTNTGWLMGL